MALQEPKLYTLNEVLHDRIFCVPAYRASHETLRDLRVRRQSFQKLQGVGVID